MPPRSGGLAQLSDPVLQFLRYGAVVVAGSLLISSVYVWLRYVA